MPNPARKTNRKRLRIKRKWARHLKATRKKWKTT